MRDRAEALFNVVAGSIAGGVLYEYHGWPGVLIGIGIALAAWSLLALIMRLVQKRRDRERPIPYFPPPEKPQPATAELIQWRDRKQRRLAMIARLDRDLKWMKAKRTELIKAMEEDPRP